MYIFCHVQQVATSAPSCRSTISHRMTQVCVCVWCHKHVFIAKWQLMISVCMICGYVMRVILDKNEQASFLLCRINMGIFAPPHNMSPSMYVCLYCNFILALLSEWLIYMKTSLCTPVIRHRWHSGAPCCQETENIYWTDYIIRNTEQLIYHHYSTYLRPWIKFPVFSTSVINKTSHSQN